jgi:flagellar hook-basal body complex protein FliE
MQRKDEQRREIDNRMLSIEELILDVQREVKEQTKKIENNDLVSFDRYLTKSVNAIFEKVQELEQISRSMQKSYVQRLTKIIDTRKQAEASFLEERKRLAALVKDLDVLYQQRNESFQSRLKNELSLMKTAYDKMKDENGTYK